MDEYSGQGEIQIDGDAQRIPFRLGSYRLHSPDTYAKGAFISKGFYEGGMEGTFTGGSLSFQNDPMSNVVVPQPKFVIDLKRGSKQSFEQAAKDQN